MTQEIREHVKTKLAECRVSATTQRLDIGEVLLCTPQHMSADQIIAKLRAAGRKVSKATVYNTLNLFVEQGLAREIPIDPERMFYDSTTSPHHHFYNVDTGELVDIPLSDVALSHMPLLPDGTRMDGVDVVIRVRPTAPAISQG